MTRHIELIHEKINVPRLKCGICDKSYASRRNLNLHIGSVHDKKKQFKCNVCDSNFSQKSNLKSHVAQVHDKRKSFRHASEER